MVRLVIALLAASLMTLSTTVLARDLAVRDGERWYAIRIDDATQLTLARTAYPIFAGVAIPPGPVKALKE